MTKILKLIKSLLKKGFATSSEKAEVRVLFKELEKEEQEVAKEDADKVEELPEKDPAEGDDDENLEKNIKMLLKRASVEQKAEILSEVKSEIKDWTEKQMEAIKKQAGNYQPDVKAKRKAVNGYLREVFKAIANNDGAKFKELTTDTEATPYGGYVTDRELNAEISFLVTEFGVARRAFNVVTLSKHSYAKNALVTDVVIAWADEGDELGSTGVVLGQEQFTLTKLFAIVTMTRELMEDQEIDLFDFIGRRVAEGFAKKEDSAFFCGEGESDTANGGYTGALYATDVNEVVMAARTGNNGDSQDGTEFTHITADDLLDMQDKSPQYVAANGTYYMHRSIRNIVRKLKDKNGEYVYQAPADNEPALIWNRPVVEVEVMPGVADSAVDTPFVIYADLKQSSLLGIKGAAIADMFDAGVVRNIAGNGDINLITTDRKAVRWIERVGAMTIFPKAITVLKTGAGS